MEEETKYELVKFIDNELELEVSVSPKEETIWMTANQMALLFNKDEKTIRKHINNIFKDGELIYNDNTQKVRVVGVKQHINMYTLNVVISVGYKVKSNIGVKFIDDNIELDVSIDPYSETIWLTQSQMSILFGVDISRISRHIKNALNEEEINSQRNLRETQITNSDKLVYLYDLDVIISVGYRVKSIKGVIFRKWATRYFRLVN